MTGSGDRVRVLLVEDDEDDYLITRDLLAEVEATSYEVEWVTDYDAALAALRGARHDVCLVDYRLGEHDGLELAGEALATARDTPLIMLTGQGDHLVDVRAAELGIADYLVKGKLDSALLERSIRFAVRTQRTLQALREGEERYRRIVETASEGVWTIDGEGKTTFVNDKLAEMLGYTVEEMLGRSLQDFVDEQNRPAAAGALGPHGLAVRHDFKFRRKDGGDLWALLSTSHLRDEEGRYAGALAMITDISERKRAEESLRRSEAGLTEAQRLVHIGSWDWDIPANVVTWSDELYRIYGLEPQQFDASYEGLLERIHPADREFVDRVVQQAYADHEPFSFYHRIVRPDGALRNLESRGEVVVSADGSLIRMFGTSQDVTELREAEEAGREAEERFRNAFDNAPIGVALVGAGVSDASRFIDVNRLLCQITGYSKEELLQTTFEAITHPDDREADRAEWGRLVAGEIASYSVEKRSLHAQGQVIWVLASVSLVRGQNGEPAYGILQVQDISERKRFQGQLQHLADHDALTGLFNRRRFGEELDRQVAYNARYGRQGAVLLVDLDRFKDVNDTLGHAVGDDLISRVASLLRERVRDTDTLARLGGDEFAVLLPESGEEHAAELAGDLLEKIREHAVVVSADRAMRVTASIGISLFAQQFDLSGEAVLINADIAMYQAKENGRNRIELLQTTEEPRARMRARITWLERIREALAHDGFVLYQQPIFDLRRQEITQHELLIRMVGAGGEVIPPGAFLAVAEQFGMIQEIDRWVIRRAVALVAERARAGHKLTLEVNLSGASMSDEGLLEFVEEEVRAGSVDPTSLIFEVTETTAIVNIEKAKHFARGLAAVGCAFALDDFGAGFGSFYYLKHLPFDYLKIDGDFIRKLPTSKTDQLTVKAIVQIAQGLEKKTIAEFVEDEPTVALLRDYGVDFAQGYQIGKAIPVAETWPVAGVAPTSVAGGSAA